MKRILSTTVALVVMGIFTAAAQAINIDVAEVQNGAVYVQGNAAPNRTITWEGGAVTTANANGGFNFVGAVPADCVGTLNDGVSTIQVVVLDCTARSMTLQLDTVMPGTVEAGAPPPPYGTVTLTLNDDKTISAHLAMAAGYFTNGLLWNRGIPGTQIGGLPAGWMAGGGCWGSTCFDASLMLFIFPPPPVPELSFYLTVPGGFSSVTEAARVTTFVDQVPGEQTLFMARVYGMDDRGIYYGGWDSWTGVEAQSSLPFSGFTAKLDIGMSPPSTFAATGTFTLDAGSNGINPTTENVALEIGTFSTVIPAGSFISHPAKRNSAANFTFLGEIDNVMLDVKITDLGNRTFQLQAKGQNANLAGTTNPIAVNLTIGDDDGSTTVNAKSH
jgi:hypothetical protein